MRKERKMKYPWTHFLTTHVWWASVLVTLIHVSVPDSPSVLIDAAFALTLGVLVTGSMVSCDWGGQFEKLFEYNNLILHVLPFAIVTSALLSNPQKAAPLWKTLILAYMLPVLYGTCAKDPEKWYRSISPHTRERTVQIMLSISIGAAALFRTFMG